MEKADYFHEKYAGSVYDTFKHACLLHVIEKYTPKVYFESHCGFASYSKPELWESSWMKIYRRTKCRCILCDINSDVRKTITLPNFTFKNVDGFEEAHVQILKHETGTNVFPTPDLFFIDPPYKDTNDWQKTAGLIERLQQTNIKWVVWYPIFTSRGTLITDHPTVEMRWQVPAGRDMYGCGMIFGNFKKRHLKSVYNGLPFLQWCLSGTPVIKKYKYPI